MIASVTVFLSGERRSWGTYSMRVIPDMLLDGHGADTRHVHIPAIDEMSARRIDCKTIAIGTALDNLHFGESYTFFVS